MAFRPKILVVESDPALRRQIESTLNLMGSEPSCVVAEEDVESRIETEKCDAAFLDWDNPAVNPEALIRLIRRSKSNAKIPVVILSGRTTTREAAKGFGAGATFFLAKPFNTNELGRLLNAARGSMLEERRRYERVPLGVPTLCEWGHRQGQRRASGRSVNISSTGPLVKLSPIPERGTAVSVELLLPGQRRSLRLKGIAARVGPGDQAAVRFVQIDEQQRELLETFVACQPASPLFPLA
jgi:CheY-like chemotaxis protein